MTIIKILIYTDKKEISRTGSVLDWKLTIVPDTLEAIDSPFVKFQVQVVNRYHLFDTLPPNEQVPIKLTPELLEEFDEIWFMGTYQQDVEQNFSEPFGGPDNELKSEEVAALRLWMNKAFGGVLMTGDHAADRPGHECDPDDKQLALGRALGHLVPRAGKLRKWEGPPTKAFEKAFRTISEVSATQDDQTPQRLQFDQVDPRGVPHELFWAWDENGKSRFIDVFPDHEHEGKLDIPEPDDEWPPFDAPAGTAKPKAISLASGTNFGPIGGRGLVLVAYDGDDLSVGRIVADSSFHHYLDLNLQGFQTTPDKSVLNLITQFYRNLAFYLIPLNKRREITDQMFRRIVSHPGVLEERGNQPDLIGRVAKRYLSLVAGPLEINEMVHLMFPAAIQTVAHNTFLPETFGNSLLPSQEVVLGSVIARHFQAVLGGSDESDVSEAAVAKAGVTEDPFTTGLRDALQSHSEKLKKIVADSEKYLALLNGRPIEPGK